MHPKKKKPDDTKKKKKIKVKVKKKTKPQNRLYKKYQKKASAGLIPPNIVINTPPSNNNDMLMMLMSMNGVGQKSNKDKLRTILNSPSLSRDNGLDEETRGDLLNELNKGNLNKKPTAQQPRKSNPRPKPDKSTPPPDATLADYYKSTLAGIKKGKNFIKENWDTILPAGVAMGAITEEQAQRWGGANGATEFGLDAEETIAKKAQEFYRNRMRRGQPPDNQVPNPPTPAPTSAPLTTRIARNVLDPVFGDLDPILSGASEGTGSFTEQLYNSMPSRQQLAVATIGGLGILATTGLERFRDYSMPSTLRQRTGDLINENIRQNEDDERQVISNTDEITNDPVLPDFVNPEGLMNVNTETPLSGRGRARQLAPERPFEFDPEQTITARPNYGVGDAETLSVGNALVSGVSQLTERAVRPLNREYVNPLAMERATSTASMSTSDMLGVMPGPGHYLRG